MEVQNTPSSEVVGSNAGNTKLGEDAILSSLRISRILNIEYSLEHSLEHALHALTLANQRFPKSQRDSLERLVVIQNVIDLLNEHPDTDVALSLLLKLQSQVDLPENKKYLQLELARYCANHNQYEEAKQEYKFLIEEERQHIGKSAPHMDYFILANLGLSATHIRNGNLADATSCLIELFPRLSFVSKNIVYDVVDQLRAISKGLKNFYKYEIAIRCLEQAEKLIADPNSELEITFKVLNERGILLKVQGENSKLRKLKLQILEKYESLLNNKSRNNNADSQKTNDAVFEIYCELVESGERKYIDKMQSAISTLEAHSSFVLNSEITTKKLKLANAYFTSGDYKRCEDILEEISQAVMKDLPEAVSTLFSSPDVFLFNKLKAELGSSIYTPAQKKQIAPAYIAMIHITATRLNIAINIGDSELAGQLTENFLHLRNYTTEASMPIGLLCTSLMYASPDLNLADKIARLDQEMDNDDLVNTDKVILFSTLAEFHLSNGNTGEATECMHTALEYLDLVNPELSISADYGTIYTRISELHVRLGESESAISFLESFEKSRIRAGIVDEPTYLKALYLLAELHKYTEPRKSRRYQQHAENLRARLEKLNDGRFFGND